MKPVPPRLDSENLKVLEELRPRFERLKAERIRAEGDIERLTRELDEARRLARDEFGTDSEDEIRRMIEETRARNTALVEEFAATVRRIDERLAKLGEDG